MKCSFAKIDLYGVRAFNSLCMETGNKNTKSKICRLVGECMRSATSSQSSSRP